MKKIFLVLMVILLFGCKGEEKIPDHLLSKEQMISMLIRLHLLEGEVNQLKIRRDSANIVFKYFENRLFENKNIQDSLYLETWAYYAEHPKVMEEIYAAVLDSLSLQERLLEERINQEN